MRVTDKTPVEGQQIFDVLKDLVDGFHLLLPLVNAEQGADKLPRTGGYFRMWQRLEADGPYIEVAALCVGELGVRLLDYLGFSREKGLRLAEHPDHVSSWESRDEDLMHYGGAIRCGPFILSFSGLPEHWDEILMVLIARRRMFLDDAQTQTIFHISGGAAKWEMMLKD